MPAPLIDPMLAPWLGVWLFDADASEYGAQPPPSDAAYTLTAGTGGVRFHVQWRLGAEPWQEVAFVVPLGVAPQPVVGPTGATSPAETASTSPAETAAVWGELTDDALSTFVQQGGVVTHSARRTLERGASSEDDVMCVVQRSPDATGAVVETIGRYRRSRVKQVMCYRRDLKMRKGKIAAQVAHASMAALLRRDVGDESQIVIETDGALGWWLRRGFAKVVLSVEDEASLLAVRDAAAAEGLPHALITDSGRTEFGGVPTRTTVAVGPAPVAWIDRITGHDGLVATKLA